MSAVPKLRFPEFYDALQATSLGQIGSVSMCKRIMKDQTRTHGDVPFFKIGTFGREPDAFISQNLFEEYKRRYSYPRKGEILISAAGTIGRLVVFDGAPAYFQDSNIVWLANSEEIVLNVFLYQFLLTVKWTTEDTTIARLYNDNLRGIPLLTPSLPEQQKIASFLSSVDKKIDLLRQKKDALELYKKGLMQKTFSQEIRFKQDDGSDFPDWEEVVLGGIGEFIRGLSYDSSQVQDDGTLVLRSTNIQNGTLNTITELQFVSKKPSPAQVLREGDIVICMANGSKRLVGKSAVYNGSANIDETTVGAFCSIFRSSDPLAPVVLEHPHYYRELHLMLAGTNINNLKNSDLATIRYFLPQSDGEKKKIALFLSAIGEKIQNTSFQIEQMETFKKGLLQQMFV